MHNLAYACPTRQTLVCLYIRDKLRNRTLCTYRIARSAVCRPD